MEKSIDPRKLYIRTVIVPCFFKNREHFFKAINSTFYDEFNHNKDYYSVESLKRNFKSDSEPFHINDAQIAKVIDSYLESSNDEKLKNFWFEIKSPTLIILRCLGNLSNYKAYLPIKATKDFNKTTVLNDIELLFKKLGKETAYKLNQNFSCLSGLSTLDSVFFMAISLNSKMHRRRIRHDLNNCQIKVRKFANCFEPNCDFSSWLEIRNKNCTNNFKGGRNSLESSWKSFEKKCKRLSFSEILSVANAVVGFAQQGEEIDTTCIDIMILYKFFLTEDEKGEEVDKVNQMQ